MANCVICNAANPCYKCPTCYAKYCSASCCQKHKADKCTPVVAKCLPVEDQKFITDNTVSMERLLMLGESKEVVSLLRSPTLRQQLIEVNQSSDPSETLKTAMKSPEFDHFATHCLNIVDPLPEDPVVEISDEQNTDLLQKVCGLLAKELNK